MIHGAHWLLYSRDADADRAFFRDVLGLQSVDAGRGWLIFKSPPSEVAVHPVEDQQGQPAAGSGMLGVELYLMCDDLQATIKWLAGKGTKCGATQEAPWGIHTTARLPSGGDIGLYQPKHPMAIGLK